MSIFSDLRKYLNQRRMIPRAPRHYIISQDDIKGCSKDELRIIQAGIARNAHEARRILQGRNATEVIASMPIIKINRLKRIERLVQRWQNARWVKMGYKPEMRIPIKVRYRKD